MNLQLLPEWVGIARRDETWLLKKYRQTKDISYLLQIYEPYMHLVYGLAYKLIKEPQQSQEVVYTLFKKLINEVHKQEIRVFSTWLYALARDYCFEWRAKARPRKDEIVALGSENRTPIVYYDQDDNTFEQEINQLENEIKNLKSEQQACLDLFFKEQKCFQEIAEITGWDIQLIKRHVRNAQRSINVYQE